MRSPPRDWTSTSSASKGRRCRGRRRTNPGSRSTGSARRVDANLAVSRGLAAFLETKFGVKQSKVLYDRPASAFTPIERGDRERFRQALFARLGIRTSTVGFIVCPTRWTEDEHFDVVTD